MLKLADLKAGQALVGIEPNLVPSRRCPRTTTN